MTFSSVTFLFFFLPVVLAAHFALPRVARNVWLVLASLLFYAWGGPSNLVLLLASIALNWAAGLAVERQGSRRTALFAAIAVNLGALVFYKYGGFLQEGWLPLVKVLGLPIYRFEEPVLPIGISFFTFHAISYLVDISRGQARAFRNPFDLALYLSFFPQLVSGPIVRFRELFPQIRSRAVTLEKFASGGERFVFGLAKKTLIADPLGAAAAHVFSLRADQLSTANAWFGIACYTLQIYFDFSGYSDMAMGLGRFFGFELVENFRYPYVARSVRDFWRRWHISLSNWFRDYLYIPLGGNQGSRGVVACRLFLVFFLCGLWHGAALTFVAWGLFHGIFLSLERSRWGRVLDAAPAPLAHAYTLVVVAFGWVLFRADSLPHAWYFWLAMTGLRSGSAYGHGIMIFHTAKTLVPFAAGLLLATPAAAFLVRERAAVTRAPGGALGVARLALVACLFVAGASFVASETFHPFLYFRF